MVLMEVVLMVEVVVHGIEGDAEQGRCPTAVGPRRICFVVIVYDVDAIVANGTGVDSADTAANYGAADGGGGTQRRIVDVDDVAETTPINVVDADDRTLGR